MAADDKDGNYDVAGAAFKAHDKNFYVLSFQLHLLLCSTFVFLCIAGMFHPQNHAIQLKSHIFLNCLGTFKTSLFPQWMSIHAILCFLLHHALSDINTKALCSSLAFCWTLGFFLLCEKAKLLYPQIHSVPQNIQLINAREQTDQSTEVLGSAHTPVYTAEIP